MIDLETRTKLCKEFFEEAHALLGIKAHSYVTDQNNAYAEAEETAREMGIHVQQVLWTYAKKHITAIRNYLREPAKVQVEDFRHRLIDLANYCALMASHPSAPEPVEADALLKTPRHRFHERCESQSIQLGTVERCTSDHGHLGMHRDASGYAWS